MFGRIHFILFIVSSGFMHSEAFIVYKNRQLIFSLRVLEWLVIRSDVKFNKPTNSLSTFF